MNYSLEGPILEAHELQHQTIEGRRARFEARVQPDPGVAPEHLDPDGGYESDEVLGPGELEGSEEAGEAEGPDEEVEVSEAASRGTFSRVQEGPQVYRSHQSKRRERAKLEGKSTPKRENVAYSRVKGASKVSVHTDTDLDTLKPGLKFNDGEAKVYTLGELLEKGFRVIRWDGMWVDDHRLLSTHAVLTLLQEVTPHPRKQGRGPRPVGWTALRRLLCQEPQRP